MKIQKRKNGLQTLKHKSRIKLDEKKVEKSDRYTQ